MKRYPVALAAIIVAASGSVAVAILTASPATAVGGYHDAAYGISASGAAPIAARPTVSSTDGRDRSASGAASSSDGAVKIGSATLRAGGGRASATVTGFSAGGVVSASSVTVTCTDGAATASVSGTPAGSVGRKATVAHGVKSVGADGATTIIGMRVTIAAGSGTEAAVINVASATCAKGNGGGKPPASSKTPGKVPTGDARPTAPAATPKDTHVPVAG